MWSQALHSVDPAVVSGHLHYLREPHKKTPEGGSNVALLRLNFQQGDEINRLLELNFLRQLILIRLSVERPSCSITATRVPELFIMTTVGFRKSDLRMK